MGSCNRVSCPYRGKAHPMEKGACLCHQKAIDESKSMELIEESTTNCSQCKHAVHKFTGCNHMTCRCGHQFCYICGGPWEDKCIENGCPQFDEDEEEEE